MTEERNYDDPAYKEFRRRVLERDVGRCQWPGCGSKRRLHVHHIRTWAEHPSLRFIEKNGITLCYGHHKMTWGKEEDYERMFMEILNQKSQRTARRKKSKKKRKRKSFTRDYLRAKAKARRREL